MAARKGARWLAPIALAATVVVIYVLVHDTLNKRKPAVPQTTGLTLTTQSTRVSTQPAAPSTQTYIVKSGDTLSGIAARFHTSLAKVEALNPKVDPSALQSGQHLRLPAG